MAKAGRARHGGAGRETRRPTTPTSSQTTGNGSAPTGQPPGQQTPEPDALGVFERAMMALQRRDFRAAREGFLTLVDRFAAENALADRARVYLAVCERELQQTAPALETLEERLTAATAALNNDQDGLAEQLLTAIVEDAPTHELGHYLTAVLLARRGDFADAVSALERAAAISPDVLAQARHDEDFDNLRGEAAFERLLTPQDQA